VVIGKLTESCQPDDMSRRYGATPSVEARVYHESRRYGATPSVEARVYHESRRYGATPSVEARVYHETTRYGATPSIEPAYRNATSSIESSERAANPRYMIFPDHVFEQGQGPLVTSSWGSDSRQNRKYTTKTDVYPTTKVVSIDPAIVCDDTQSKTRFSFAGYRADTPIDDGKFSKFALHGRWTSTAEQEISINTMLEPNEVVMEFCGFPRDAFLRTGRLEDARGHFWISGDTTRRLPALRALSNILNAEGDLPFVADLSQEQRLLFQTMSLYLTENDVEKFQVHQASSRFTEFWLR
jgi:hypothetical protein